MVTIIHRDDRKGGGKKVQAINEKPMLKLYENPQKSGFN